MLNDILGWFTWNLNPLYKIYIEGYLSQPSHEKPAVYYSLDSFLMNCKFSSNTLQSLIVFHCFSQVFHHHQYCILGTTVLEIHTEGGTKATEIHPMTAAEISLMKAIEMDEITGAAGIGDTAENESPECIGLISLRCNF